MHYADRGSVAVVCPGTSSVAAVARGRHKKSVTVLVHVLVQETCESRDIEDDAMPVRREPTEAGLRSNETSQYTGNYHLSLPRFRGELQLGAACPGPCKRPMCPLVGPQEVWSLHSNHILRK